MAKVICPDCGFVHECGNNLDVAETKANRPSKLWGSRSYSCICACGCGHTCELMYGPYAKAHNAKGKAALEGEVGKQIKPVRKASARIRREHLARYMEQQKASESDFWVHNTSIRRWNLVTDLRLEIGGIRSDAGGFWMLQ